LNPPRDLPDKLYSDWLYDIKKDLLIKPPSAINNTVSPELDAAIIRSLAFDSNKRIKHAGELLDALNFKAQPSSPILNEALTLIKSGELERAALCWERVLKSTSLTEETRFAIADELARALSKSGRNLDAAKVLHQAWDCFVNRGALFRTRPERYDFLQRISDLYCKGGNIYKGNVFLQLSENELGHGGK
jgi:tetratricopeptide (TPR) repeat protein